MIRARAAPGKAHPGSIQWLPAERLGQLSVDAQVRPWLIGKGLLTQRLKAVCGERFGLRLIDQWTGVLSAAYQSALRSTPDRSLSVSPSAESPNSASQG